jgi:hypothetical protein
MGGAPIGACKARALSVLSAFIAGKIIFAANGTQNWF